MSRGKKICTKLNEHRRRLTDDIWYKMQKTMPTFIFTVLIGIVGYFLNDFTRNIKESFEKNAMAHSNIFDRIKEQEELGKYTIQSLVDFKVDIIKRLDKIELKLDHNNGKPK